MADFSPLYDPETALAFAAVERLRSVMGLSRSDEIEFSGEMTPPEGAGPFFVRVHGAKSTAIRHPNFLLHQSCSFAITVSVRSRGFPRDIMGFKLSGGEVGAKWLLNRAMILLHQSYELLDDANELIETNGSQFFVPVSCDFSMDLQTRQNSWWGSNDSGFAGVSATANFSGAEIIRDVSCMRANL